MLRVVEFEIPNNVRTHRISGTNFRAPAHETRRLIEIGCLHYIRGNHRIVFPRFPDAVDLDCEEDWDSVSLESAGNVDGFRCAPTVTVQDNASAALLGNR